MKTFFRYVVCPLVMVSYIFAYMGFGIHRCSVEGTSDFVFLAGDISCEAIHGHSHHHNHHDGCECCSCGECHHLGGEQNECCSCGDEHHHSSAQCHCGHPLECHCLTVHSAECCTTDIYVVSDSQNSNDDSDSKFETPSFFAFGWEMSQPVWSIAIEYSGIDRYLDSSGIVQVPLHPVLRV